MAALADLIRAHRESLGLSTGMYAQLVGTSRQNIENVEAGEVRQPRYIAKLAKTLGVTVDDLLAGRVDRKDLHPATQGPTAPLAQEPSFPYPIILPTTIEWESLMGAVLPKRFACVIRDEAMSPAMRPGYLAIFDSSLEPQPGDVVLLADADNTPHVREYRVKRGDHWLAVATNQAYAELDSRADGLRVLAVHVGGIWR